MAISRYKLGSDCLEDFQAEVAIFSQALRNGIWERGGRLEQTVQVLISLLERYAAEIEKNEAPDLADLDSCVECLWQAVHDGVYDPRSIVGDGTLRMQAILERWHERFDASLQSRSD